MILNKYNFQLYIYRLYLGRQSYCEKVCQDGWEWTL